MVRANSLVTALTLTVWTGTLQFTHAVEVQGNVNGVWEAADSPFIVVNDVTIPDGQRLIIEPGVEVRLNSAKRVYVLGTLTANGTERDSIQFISSNGDQYWGGIRVTNQATATLSFCLFSKSRQTVGYPNENSRGGAVYGSASNLEILNCTFRDNRSSGEGGAACFYNCQGEFSNNHVHSNYGYTGIVWLQSSDLPASSNIFEFNRGDYGAGLIMEGSSSPVENSIFRHNESGVMRWGGALYLVNNSRSPTRNNLIVDNQGGGIFIGYGADPTPFEHNTIANNGGHSGVFMVNGGEMSAVNSIFWGNDGPDIAFSGGTASIRFCDADRAQGVQAGQGVIRQDPRFANVNQGDYNLQDNSPCIDTGDPDSPDDPDGSRADMGYIYPNPFIFEFPSDTIDFGLIGREDVIRRQFRLTYANGLLDEVLIQLSLEEDIDWIQITPEEETIDLGGSADINLVIDPPQDLAPGSYLGNIEVFIEEQRNPFISIPVQGFVVEGFGNLAGRAFDQLTGRPVENARLVLSGFPLTTYEARSNAAGEFSLPRLPAWRYQARFTHPDFDPTLINNLDLEPGADFDLPAPLRYAAASPGIDEIRVGVAPWGNLSRRIMLANTGSNPLQFDIDLHFPGLDDVEPYDLVETIPIEAITGDSRLQGFEVIGEEIYLCGGNSAEGRGKIWVINRDGELIRRFDQFIDSNFGLRDLAWDGELLWGGDGPNIYGFDLDGNLVTQFESPLNLTRCITWDSQHDLLWIGDVTTDFYSLDRDGNVVERINRPGPRIYGAAFRRNDPDDAGLYFYCTNAENQLSLQKFNPSTRVLFFLSNLDAGAAFSAGAGITTSWDRLQILFGAILKNGIENDGLDQLGFYSLSSRTDWLGVSPMEGVVAPGNEIGIDLTFEPTDLPESWLEAAIVINHNGRGDEFEIPISMLIRPAGNTVERSIRLRSGLNLVSLPVEPENPGVQSMFAPLVNAGLIEFIKDSRGRFYFPQRGGFNNIPRWNPLEGYLVGCRGAANLSVMGCAIREDEPIPLRSGWQNIAYLPAASATPDVALADIADRLLLIKDLAGHFYSPRWEFTNLDALYSGFGYRVSMSAATDLIWQTGEGRIASIPSVKPTHFTELPVTGSDMSLLILSGGSLDGEVAVYSGGRLAGSGVFQNGKCGISVRGAESGLDGALEGDPLTLKVWAYGREIDGEVDMLEGELTFHADAFAVGKLTAETVRPLPSTFKLHPPTPNPFNTRATISFELPGESPVTLKVFDTSGREVATLTERSFDAGYHKLVWNAEAVPAGIYFVRMNAAGFSSIERIALVR